jgi:hypothetical protein
MPPHSEKQGPKSEVALYLPFNIDCAVWTSDIWDASLAIASSMSVSIVDFFLLVEVSSESGD